jgi:hypothetical protein
MPEKGRRDSTIGTNGYWPELLAVKKNPKTKGARRCRGHVRLKYLVWGSSLIMEQCAVVQFLTLRKLSVMDIMVELNGVCGHEALSLSAVRKWRKRFVNGRITLEDDPRSGRPR